MEILFQNKKIHFTSNGSGSTVVLLHGFTESLEIWNDFVAELSPKYQVVCIDLPGHGKSEILAEVHTMELMAEAVKAVLDSLNVKHCVVCGHSMGGYVSLALGSMYPGLLKGLVLFHSSALPDTAEQAENRKRAIAVIEESHHSFLMRFIPDLFAEANKEKYKVEIEKLVEQAKKMHKEAIIAAQKGMLSRKDHQDYLKKADHPVLFISGHQDSRIPAERILPQIALPSESYALFLKECGHMGYLENKAETLHSIRSFLERIFG